jgi:hypothetical protein
VIRCWTMPEQRSMLGPRTTMPTVTVPPQGGSADLRAAELRSSGTSTPGPRRTASPRPSA